MRNSTMRGFLSPRRSKPGTATTPDNQGSDEKETHFKANQRSSSTSSLNSSKSTTKHQPQIAATNNSILSFKSAPESSFTSSDASSRTTKSTTRPTTSKKNAKAGTGSRAKPTLVTKDNTASHKYFDTPNASPTHFPSSARLAVPVLHNQLQHRLSIDDGKNGVASNVLHTNSINESVSSGTNEQYDSQSNTPTILSKIYEEIASHRKGNTSIKSYFRNLKALWDEPAPTFSELPQSSSKAIMEQSELLEREKLMQFLLGLNISYSSLCSQILLLSPSPTLDEAYSLIIQEQRSRKMGKKNSN